MTKTQMVRNVTALYRSSTIADRNAGLGWYDEAYRVSVELAPENPAMAAGVIAALSPRCQWSTNIEWARKVITAARNGDECPNVHTTAMRKQAWRIANGEYALDVLNGPKVRAFFSNITGDTNAVTCDVWAVFAATGSKDAKAVSTPKRYAEIADVYRRAAKRLGVSPRDCQAAVWVAVRGTKPTDASFHASSALALAA